MTTVKEAVDNALDACEEAGILPELRVEVFDEEDGAFRVAVEDNGPGIVENQITRILGKLLYGSKFHKLSQSRGQQGMGIAVRGRGSVLKTAIGGDWKGKLSLAAYATAIPASFWSPAIGWAIYVLIALLWLVPDRRIEHVLGNRVVP